MHGNACGCAYVLPSNYHWCSSSKSWFDLCSFRAAVISSCHLCDAAASSTQVSFAPRVLVACRKCRPFVYKISKHINHDTYVHKHVYLYIYATQNIAFNYGNTTRCSEVNVCVMLTVWFSLLFSSIKSNSTKDDCKLRKNFKTSATISVV